MFCTNCGSKIIGSGKFCTQCGNPVTHTQKIAEMEALIPTEGINTREETNDDLETNEQEVSNKVEIKDEVTEETGSMEVTEVPEETAISEATDNQGKSDLANIDAITHNEIPIKANKRWLMVGLSAILLIVLIGSYTMWNNKQSPLDDNAKGLVSNEQSPAVSVDASTIEDPTITPVDLSSITIHAVDISNYPVITVKINTGDLNGWIPTTNDLTITENITKQVVDQIIPSSNDIISVSYTTNQIHKGPGAMDQRAIELQLLDAKAQTNYEAPQPLSLRMGDISYNTDNYPDINLYFSLYDAYDKLVETLPTDISLFNVKEEEQLIPITEVAKMSDQKESLSVNVVIDDSGSMSGIMSVVKQEATQFLDNINITQNDRIALMSFAGASEIYQNAFSSVTDDLKPQINALRAEGTCTALYRAIEVAVYNTAYNGESGSKYVVIFTDGGENCSNDGIENQNNVSPQTVINMANQLGVPIYAVGVDQDDQLQAITQQTNGDYISIGSDLDRLGQFYQSIFSKKKAQYVVKYRSEISKKAPRSTSISLNTPQYYSSLNVSVTPRLIDDPDVARTMEAYQINWSLAMSTGEMSYLTPYVVVDSSSPTSVYKIVSDQVIALNNAKKNGTMITFNIPTYTLIDAKKVSDTHQQLQLRKHFKRTVTDNGLITSTQFKSTAYTYNLIKQNEQWFVESTVEKSVPETCYTDETYTAVKACK